MKTIILLSILLLSFSYYSQFETQITNQDNLVGKWYLHETIITDNSSLNENYFSSIEHFGRELLISSDSIKIYPDDNLRYYKRGPIYYKYLIEPDSILNGNTLKLYSGKKKNERIIKEYDIERSTKNEIVLKSFVYETDGLEMVDLTYYTIYRKDSLTKLRNLIIGDWINCSTKSKSIVINQDDFTEIEFNRSKSNSECVNEHTLRLTFVHKGIENDCFISSYDSNIGNGLITSYEIDELNRLIFFGDEIVYAIIELNESKMILKKIK